MNNEVYILDALRSPIGARGGRLAALGPERLTAPLLDALHERLGTPEIDAVIGGNAVGPGGNITRLSLLYSRLGEQVPAWTIDMQCASALAAIADGAARISAGLARTVLAGGAESASLQPLRTYAAADPRQGSYTVAQFSPEENDPQAMLRGAQRAVEHCGATREELDAAALASHRRAVQAAGDGVLRDYILPFPELVQDEGLRPRLSAKLLARMPALLGENTQITAGNACLIHDGAAYVALADGETARRSGRKPIARIVTLAAGASAPLLSPLGVRHVSELALRQAGLQMADMAAVEWNEAFAVIDVLFARHYPTLVDRYNALGGALAYGHPYGASGAIILTHLLARLQQIEGRYGLAAIAGAGGTGMAIIVERLP